VSSDIPYILTDAARDNGLIVLSICTPMVARFLNGQVLNPGSALVRDGDDIRIIGNTTTSVDRLTREPKIVPVNCQITTAQAACLLGCDHGHPVPRIRPHQRCQVRRMTRFLVGFDIRDLRSDPIWFLDPDSPFDVYESFLRAHDCREDIVYDSSYNDPTRLGRCGRPLERCDLTCPVQNQLYSYVSRDSDIEDDSIPF